MKTLPGIAAFLLTAALAAGAAAKGHGSVRVYSPLGGWHAVPGPVAAPGGGGHATVFRSLGAPRAVGSPVVSRGSGFAAPRAMFATPRGQLQGNFASGAAIGSNTNGLVESPGDFHAPSFAHWQKPIAINNAFARPLTNAPGAFVAPPDKAPGADQAPAASGANAITPNSPWFLSTYGNSH